MTAAAGRSYPESDPRHYTGRIKRMLMDTVAHAKSEAHNVDDLQAEALFETTAEVLQGLIKAYDQFETKADRAVDRAARAWR
jgi:hypothetical protein